MDALVLSGGSVKGAYQAGAVESVLASGYRPQIITGISVGALNAAFLAAYPNEGKRLTQFWETEITSPNRVVRKRPWYELAYRILFKEWDGVVDTKRLDVLVRKLLGDEFPQIGGPRTAVGSVNLETGALVYTEATEPDFIDAVLASAAEPVALPLRYLRGVPHYDGGLRDITPLKQAISMGATRIVAVVCQPANLSPLSVRTGDLMNVVGRVLGIATNEIGQNDFTRLEAINQLLAELPADVLSHPYFATKRQIPLTVIRPRIALGVDLESFTSADIRQMVDQGRTDARAMLEMDLAA